MKRLFIAASFVLLTACAHQGVTPTPQSVASAMPHMKRGNLVVADIERSLKIYEDILGLTAGTPSVSGPDSYSYPVFNIPKGTPMRSVTLDEPREARTLALTELKGIALPKPRNAPFMSTLVIGITDLEEKFKQLEALGLHVTESKIAVGAEFRFIEQAFVDFDGHLIVCYEALPS